VEAGIVLTGTEIKSIRLGKCNLRDAYIDFSGQEAFINEMHIGLYEQGNRFNHQEKRVRKLLLHKHQIFKLAQSVKAKGYTIVPTKMYFVKGRVKVEIALAKGKELHDKRDSLKEKEVKRELEKAMKIRY
jgi:SsrA-binding protein